MKIEELVSSIKRHEIVVPEFQREYVWNQSRSKELIHSLLNEYPVGGVLIWKTDEPPHLKGSAFNEGHEPNRTYQVLLDGQQRSSALYMLITGELPPYYKEDEIGDDPRQLAFNLYSRELRYWRGFMNKDESWQLVTDIMLGKINFTSLAISVHRKFQKLNEISDFDFDFSVRDRSRVFGEVRSLVESAGLQMNFASQQIWKILLPSQTVNVTISQLDDLYKGSVRGKHEREWDQDDHLVDEGRFKAFWKNNIASVAENLAEDHSDLEKLMMMFSDNFTALTNIKRLDIFRQDIPQSAKFTDAIDIFDKINSQGVHLSNAELALTHFTAIWPDTRRKMKSFLGKLVAKNFHLNLTFTTRLLILAACGRASLSSLSAASYEPIRDLTKEQIVSAWNLSEKVFSYLVDVLRSEKITNSEIIRSKNVLFPLFYYALLSGGNFKTDAERRSAIFWLHNALIWGRYAGSADQKLEEDVNIIKNSRDEAWSVMINKIVDQRGRIKLKASDLEGSGADSRIFNTYYVMLKHKGAQDWFTGVSIDSPEDSDFGTHRHHIFPKAHLVRQGYSEQNKIQNALMNEIANLAIITDETNIKISDKEPFKYLKSIEEKYPNALQNQLIPNDTRLWKNDNFIEFLKTRRELIASEINSFLEKYREQSSDNKEVSEARHLWSMPENEMLEFKETWQYDIYQSAHTEKKVKNPKLQLANVKTVAGFLNTRGGDLLIGISDSNQVEGLERDQEFFGGSMDKLELNINQVLTNSLGIGKSPYYSVKIVHIDGKEVCHIRVIPCKSAKSWVKFNGEDYFFIRQGNGTRSLTGEEADQYWSEMQNSEYSENNY